MALDVPVGLVVCYYYQGLRHAAPNGNRNYRCLSVPALVVILLLLWGNLVGAWQLAIWRVPGAYQTAVCFLAGLLRWGACVVFFRPVLALLLPAPVAVHTLCENAPGGISR